MARPSNKAEIQAQAQKAASVIITQGYMGFLGWMGRNLATAAAKQAALAKR
jgi:hypothetical protein